GVERGHGGGDDDDVGEADCQGRQGAVAAADVDADEVFTVVLFADLIDQACVGDADAVEGDLGAAALVGLALPGRSGLGGVVGVGVGDGLALGGPPVAQEEGGGGFADAGLVRGEGDDGRAVDHAAGSFRSCRSSSPSARMSSSSAWSRMFFIFW